MLNKKISNPIIVPQFDCKLNLDERGLISMMSNIPEADYLSINQLCEIANVPQAKLKKILNSLVDKGYLIFVNDVYAVNKIKIKDMELVQ